MTVFDIIVPLIGVLFGFLGLTILQKNDSPSDQAAGRMALLVQTSFSLMVFTIISFFYGGDMMWYYRTGTELSRQTLNSPSTHLPEVVGLLFHSTNIQYLEVPTLMAGGATGSMHAMGTLFMLLTGGSLAGTCVIIGMLTLFSKILMYQVFRSMFPQYAHKRLFWALLYLPSVGFWAGGLLKEAFALIGMGPIIWGIVKGMRGKVFQGLIAIVVGGFFIGIFKPYVLFPLVLSAAAGWYWYSNITKFGEVKLLKSPFKIAILLAIGIGGILMLGKIFPQYSIENIAEETASLQSYGASREGRGSSYAVGDHTDSSLSGQAAFLPVGLIFSLFRPLPFEVRNPAMLLNALEILVFLALWFKIFTIRPPRKTWGMIVSHPLLVFSLLFVVGFGSIVGISTTNIGTLSRYRVPMMPFYAVLLAVLSLKTPSEQNGARA